MNKNIEAKTTTKPCTLAEIRALAAPVFKDKAVVSVNITAAFGLVEVLRCGTVKMAS